MLTALGYGTFGRYDIEQRVGGNPSQNVGVDYSTRISADERALLELVSPGSTDKQLALLAAGPRVSADAAARAKLAATGTPTGTFSIPMITMHTAADPLVLVQNETVYKAEHAASNSTGDLIQLFTVAPTTYSSPPGAPYGAGHCNFTTQSRLAVVNLLNNWVQNGVYPGTVAIATAMGDNSGYEPLLHPGAVAGWLLIGRPVLVGSSRWFPRPSSRRAASTTRTSTTTKAGRDDAPHRAVGEPAPPPVTWATTAAHTTAAARWSCRASLA